MVSKTVELAPAVAPVGDRRSYVLVATYLPLRSFWKVIPFFRMNNRVEKQLRASKGIVRYALRTDIPRKRFWTLSVWTDRENMALFSRSEPHRTAMKKFYEWGTDKAAIAEWTSSDGSLNWKEAEKKLETPMFHYKYASGKRLVHAPGSKSVNPSEEGEDDDDNNPGNSEET